jgi:hypothetical protein
MPSAPRQDMNAFEHRPTQRAATVLDVKAVAINIQLEKRNI